MAGYERGGQEKPRAGSVQPPTPRDSAPMPRGLEASRLGGHPPLGCTASGEGGRGTGNPRNGPGGANPHCVLTHSSKEDERRDYETTTHIAGSRRGSVGVLLYAIYA